MIDVSNALLPQHRDAGLRLLEPDDHIVTLVRDGYLLGVFGQNARRDIILKVADMWMSRTMDTEHLVPVDAVDFERFENERAERL